MEKHTYKYVIGLSSSYGRDIIPRLAGKYDSQPVSDITQIIVSNNLSRNLKHLLDQFMQVML